MKSTPLVGNDASEKGRKLYLRGTTWDANHMDRFINSDINKRLSVKDQTLIYHEKSINDEPAIIKLI